MSFLARSAPRAQSHGSAKINWLGTGSTAEVSHEFYGPSHTNSSPRFQQYTFLKITENIGSLLLVFHNPSVLREQFLSHAFCNRGSICSQQAELSLDIWLGDSTQFCKFNAFIFTSYNVQTGFAFQSLRHKLPHAESSATPWNVAQSCAWALRSGWISLAYKETVYKLLRVFLPFSWQLPFGYRSEVRRMSWFQLG